MFISKLFLTGLGIRNRALSQNHHVLFFLLLVTSNMPSNMHKSLIFERIEEKKRGIFHPHSYTYSTSCDRTYRVRIGYKLEPFNCNLLVSLCTTLSWLFPLFISRNNWTLKPWTENKSSLNFAYQIFFCSVRSPSLTSIAESSLRVELADLDWLFFIPNNHLTSSLMAWTWNRQTALDITSITTVRL